MVGELCINIGTMIPFFIILYFVVKWAVKNGIRQYYSEKEQYKKMKQQLDEYHMEQKENTYHWSDGKKGAILCKSEEGIFYYLLRYYRL